MLCIERTNELRLSSSVQLDFININVQSEIGINELESFCLVLLSKKHFFVRKNEFPAKKLGTLRSTTLTWMTTSFKIFGI